MLMFERTNFSIAQLLMILGTITFVITSTPAYTEQPPEVPERESLRGLVGVEVFVETLNIDIEQQGLKTLALQNVIRQRLQKSGVKVLTERERLASPTAAMLVVRVDTLHDRIGRYFYSIELLFTQRVRLAGCITSELSAVTWMKPGSIGIVADDKVTHIEDQVLHKVDHLIKDYLAVNPAP